MSVPSIKTAVIANGGTVSGAVNLEGYNYGSLVIPTLTTGSITFQTSADGITFVALKSAIGSPADVTIVCGTGNFSIDLPGSVMYHLWVKIVTAGTQAAERTFLLVLK